MVEMGTTEKGKRRKGREDDGGVPLPKHWSDGREEAQIVVSNEKQWVCYHLAYERAFEGEEWVTVCRKCVNADLWQWKYGRNHLRSEHRASLLHQV